MGNVIEFKSTPENFAKEECGDKSNTVRKMNDWSYARIKSFVDAEFVRISCTDTRFGKFTRPITDKTVYDGLAIISFKH